MGFRWLREFGAGEGWGGKCTMEMLRDWAANCVTTRRELDEYRESGSMSVAEHAELASRLSVIKAWVDASIDNGGPLPPPDELSGR